MFVFRVSSNNRLLMSPRRDGERKNNIIERYPFIASPMIKGKKLTNIWRQFPISKLSNNTTGIQAIRPLVYP